MTVRDMLVKAIWGNFSSPNECDRNGEEANVVDGLYSIARSLDRLAKAVERFSDMEVRNGSQEKPF